MNKSGQIFPIFLVFLTLLMCGSVLFIYSANQDKVSASLVSPKTVLEMRDDVKIFELQEFSLINESLVAAEGSGEFGTKEFLDSFRRSFFEGLDKNSGITSFVIDGVYLNGNDVSAGATKNTDAFFENALYPEILTYYDKGKLYFGRASLEKKARLETENKLKNNFVVDLNFNFDKKYLISKKGSKFVVEEE